MHFIATSLFVTGFWLCLVALSAGGVWGATMFWVSPKVQPPTDPVPVNNENLVAVQDRSPLDCGEHESRFRLNRSTSPVTVNQLRFARSQVEIGHSGDRSILATAEAAGIGLDSGCQRGDCETCLARIIKGHVRYPAGKIPNVGATECLPCIAVPASDLELDL